MKWSDQLFNTIIDFSFLFVLLFPLLELPLLEHALKYTQLSLFNAQDKENKQDGKGDDKKSDYESKYRDYIDNVDKESKSAEERYRRLYEKIMFKLGGREKRKTPGKLRELITRIYRAFSKKRIRYSRKSNKYPYAYRGINYNIFLEFYYAFFGQTVYPVNKKRKKLNRRFGEVMYYLFKKKIRPRYRESISEHKTRFIGTTYYILYQFYKKIRLKLTNTVLYRVLTKPIARPNKWTSYWLYFMEELLPEKVNHPWLRWLFSKPWVHQIFDAMTKNRVRAYRQRKPRQRSKKPHYFVGKNLKRKKKKSRKIRRKIRNRTKFDRVTAWIYVNYLLRKFNLDSLIKFLHFKYSQYPIFRASGRHFSYDLFSLLKLARRRLRRKLKKNKYLFKSPALWKLGTPSTNKKKKKREESKGFYKVLRRFRIAIQYKISQFRQTVVTPLISRWLSNYVPASILSIIYRFKTYYGKAKLDLRMAAYVLLFPDSFEKKFKEDFDKLSQYKWSYIYYLLRDPYGSQKLGQSFYFYLKKKFDLLKSDRYDRQVYINSLFKAWLVRFLTDITRSPLNNPFASLVYKSDKLNKFKNHLATLYGFLYKTDRYRPFKLRKGFNKKPSRLIKTIRRLKYLGDQKVKQYLKTKYSQRSTQYRPFKRYLKLKLAKLLSEKIRSIENWKELVDFCRASNFRASSLSFFIKLSYHLKNYILRNKFKPHSKRSGLKSLLFNKKFRKMRLLKKLMKKDRDLFKPKRRSMTRLSRASTRMNQTRQSTLNNPYFLIKEILNKYISQPTSHYYNSLLSFFSSSIYRINKLPDLFLKAYGFKSPYIRNSNLIGKVIEPRVDNLHQIKYYVELLANQFPIDHFIKPIVDKVISFFIYTTLAVIQQVTLHILSGLFLFYNVIQLPVVRSIGTFLASYLVRPVKNQMVLLLQCIVTSVLLIEQGMIRLGMVLEAIFLKILDFVYFLLSLFIDLRRVKWYMREKLRSVRRIGWYVRRRFGISRRNKAYLRKKFGDLRRMMRRIFSAPRIFRNLLISITGMFRNLKQTLGETFKSIKVTLGAIINISIDRRRGVLRIRFLNLRHFPRLRPYVRRTRRIRRYLMRRLYYITTYDIWYRYIPYIWYWVIPYIWYYFLPFVRHITSYFIHEVWEYIVDMFYTSIEIALYHKYRVVRRIIYRIIEYVLSLTSIIVTLYDYFYDICLFIFYSGPIIINYIKSVLDSALDPFRGLYLSWMQFGVRMFARPDIWGGFFYELFAIPLIHVPLQLIGIPMVYLLHKLELLEITIEILYEVLPYVITYSSWIIPYLYPVASFLFQFETYRLFAIRLVDFCNRNILAAYRHLQSIFRFSMHLDEDSLYEEMQRRISGLVQMIIINIFALYLILLYLPQRIFADIYRRVRSAIYRSMRSGKSIFPELREYLRKNFSKMTLDHKLDMLVKYLDLSSEEELYERLYQHSSYKRQKRLENATKWSNRIIDLIRFIIPMYCYSVTVVFFVHPIKWISIFLIRLIKRITRSIVSISTRSFKYIINLIFRVDIDKMSPDNAFTRKFKQIVQDIQKVAIGISNMDFWSLVIIGPKLRAKLVKSLTDTILMLLGLKDFITYKMSSIVPKMVSLLFYIIWGLVYIALKLVNAISLTLVFTVYKPIESFFFLLMGVIYLISFPSERLFNPFFKYFFRFWILYVSAILKFILVTAPRFIFITVPSSIFRFIREIIRRIINIYNNLGKDQKKKVKKAKLNRKLNKYPSSKDLF